MPEMAAEKLRALAQRVRHTDLADLAEILVKEDVRDEDIEHLAAFKFELVKKGVANRAERIQQHLGEMQADYDGVVPALFPQGRSYSEAIEIVWPRIGPLIP
jgi:Nucleotidyl transferase AbiEii toxin, Type IV TA system